LPASISFPYGAFWAMTASDMIFPSSAQFIRPRLWRRGHHPIEGAMRLAEEGGLAAGISALSHLIDPARQVGGAHAAQSARL
jgi:hypothetical protein